MAGGPEVHPAQRGAALQSSAQEDAQDAGRTAKVKMGEVEKCRRIEATGFGAFCQGMLGL